MAVVIEIKVDNTNLTLEALAEAKVRALMKCGATAENYAKQGSPVDTGRLRNSIKHMMENENTVAIGTDVNYAIYQELGTSRGVKPKLYLTNSLRNHLSEYENIIRAEFTKG